MKYLSIDIETTGTDPNDHQMIEFAAIIENSNLQPLSYDEVPKYRRIVLARDGRYVFSSMAAKINANLIETIAKIENGEKLVFENNKNLTNTVLFSDELLDDFKLWLRAQGFVENSKGIIEIVAAGKNFGSFDKNFIQALPEFESYGLRFHYRSLDPSMGFVNWKTDEVPPSSNQCLSRAGIDKSITHNALSDAWDVIEMLRVQYSNNIDHRPVPIFSSHS